jgi:hypothetical protein
LLQQLHKKKKLAGSATVNKTAARMHVAEGLWLILNKDVG